MIARGFSEATEATRVGKGVIGKEDSIGALHVASNPATPKSKHIDIRHHFIRERVERVGNFRLSTCRPSYSMPIFSLSRCTTDLSVWHRQFAMNL